MKVHKLLFCHTSHAVRNYTHPLVFSLAFEMIV